MRLRRAPARLRPSIASSFSTSRLCMYVPLRPLRAVAHTSQCPQREQPSRGPVPSAAAAVDPAAGASVVSQPNFLRRSSDFESGLGLVSQPSFVRRSSDFESGLGLSAAHAGQSGCCFFLIVLDMLDQRSHLHLHAYVCMYRSLGRKLQERTVSRSGRSPEAMFSLLPLLFPHLLFQALF